MQTYLSTYLRTYVHTNVPTYLRTYLPTYLPTVHYFIALHYIVHYTLHAYIHYVSFVYMWQWQQHQPLRRLHFNSQAAAKAAGKPGKAAAKAKAAAPSAPWHRLSFCEAVSSMPIIMIGILNFRTLAQNTLGPWDGATATGIFCGSHIGCGNRTRSMDEQDCERPGFDTQGSSYRRTT